jgi:hypothetical protein
MCPAQSKHCRSAAHDCRLCHNSYCNFNLQTGNYIDFSSNENAKQRMLLHQCPELHSSPDGLSQTAGAAQTEKLLNGFKYYLQAFLTAPKTADFPPPAGNRLLKTQKTCPPTQADTFPFSRLCRPIYAQN